MAKFKPGQSGNPNGRPKGSKNKASLRNTVEAIIHQHFDPQQVEEDLLTLEPRDRLNFLLRLLEYSLPKLRSQEFKTDLESLTDEDLDRIINKLIDDNYEQN